MAVENAAPETTTLSSGRSQAQLLVEPFSERMTVTAYRIDAGELPQFSAEIVAFARRRALSKIAWLARASEWQALLGQGFVLEAVVPHFLQGEKCFFMARFTDEDRRTTDRFVSEDRIVDQVKARAEDDDDGEAPAGTPPGYEVAPWEGVAAGELRRFYEEIFASYPTPLTEPGYIERQLEEGRAVGRLALHGGRIASSAAVELDLQQGNGEVTDCGTAPAHRGRGLNSFLIAQLEPEAWQRGIRCLYAMARARSYGMNLILHRGEYAFGGRLVKHSHIAGQIEDMNVWYKCER